MVRWWVNMCPNCGGESFKIIEDTGDEPDIPIEYLCVCSNCGWDYHITKLDIRLTTEKEMIVVYARK